MKKIFLIITIIFISIILYGCSNYSRGSWHYDKGYIVPNYNNDDEYSDIQENPFIRTEVKNTSNISLSSNTASYSTIRNFINEGIRVNKDSVRIEEMINFFNYSYNEPDEGNLFGFTTELIQTPWDTDTHLLLVGLQTEKRDLSSITNNLVLLLDVSGSMSDTNKLPLVKQAMNLLLENMKENDIVSVVTYSSGEKVVVDGGTYDQKSMILNKINELKAYGSTAGKKGLDMAYEVAQKHFIPEGNNRIILATDGDFNVGISDTNSLVEYISEKRETGIYFSAFGFGYGNYKDEKLERLAKAGNGTHYYIDDLLSAKKAFVDDIDGTLYTIARDAKAQIKFNQDKVKEFRIIGYENRMMSDDEFNDDTTDAGEIGTGLQVTAIFQLKLNNESLDDVASVEIKYKEPSLSDNNSFSEKYDITNNHITSEPSEDSIFISSVIEFGLILRNSQYKAEASINRVLEQIENLESVLNDLYKLDFIEIVKKAKNIGYR